MVIKIREIRRKRCQKIGPKLTSSIKLSHPQWEGFMEKVSFESGVELRWSDA